MIVLWTTVGAWGCAGGWEYERDECLCYCPEPVLVFPPSGTVLPTNPVFHIDGINGFRWLQDGERFDVTTEFRSTSAVSVQLGYTRPDEPLTPDAVIELWALDVYPNVLVGTWTVGDGPDTEPPTWTGEYEVETIDDRKDDCGFPEHSHYITWQGLSEGPLFVLAEGVGETITDQIGDDQGLDVRWNGCTVEDNSLAETFHREYRVTFEDSAGHAIGPFEVRTGRNVLGCGGPNGKEQERVFGPSLPGDADSRTCGGAGGSSVPLIGTLLVALLVASRRRRWLGESRRKPTDVDTSNRSSPRATMRPRRCTWSMPPSCRCTGARRRRET